MTQEEILEYNKRCAEFLKGMKYIKTHPDSDYNKYSNLRYVWQVDTHNFKLPMLKELSKKVNNFNLGSVNLGYQIKLTELKFHSDWNWIMEVVEAIENLGFWVKIFGFTSFGNIQNQCSIKKQKPKSDNEYIYEFDGDWNDSKKEAVVQAINQFLIWYKEQTL